MTRRGPWFLSRDRYPTADDLRHGIIAAAKDGEHWMFWDMQFSADFAVKNFGSPPTWWAFIADVAPDSFSLSVTPNLEPGCGAVDIDHREPYCPQCRRRHKVN